MKRMFVLFLILFAITAFGAENKENAVYTKTDNGGVMLFAARGNDGNNEGKDDKNNGSGKENSEEKGKGSGKDNDKGGGNDGNKGGKGKGGSGQGNNNGGNRGKSDEDHGKADEDHGKDDEDHGKDDEKHGKSDEDHGNDGKDRGGIFHINIHSGGWLRFFFHGGSDTYIARRTRAGAIFRSFLLPGWGQAYKGRYFKGWTFICTTVAFDWMNLHNYAIYLDKKEAYDNDPGSDVLKLSYENAEKDYTYILAAHLAFWTLNMIDVIFFDWDKVDFSLKSSGKTCLLALEFKF